MKYLFYIMQWTACFLLFFYDYISHSEPIFGSGSSDIRTEQVLMVLFFLTVIISQYIFFTISKEKMLQESEMKDRLYQAQERYYHLLLEREHETRKIRHDMRNHMMCIHELLNRECYTQGKAYVEEYMGQLTRLACVIYTGNDILDIIVNDICSRYAVEIDFRGRFPEKTLLSDFEMCTLFANLLTNSVEAAEKTDKRQVYFAVQQRNNAIKIEVKNPVIEEPQWRKGRFRTIKENKYKHGLGTENIEAVIKKYHGTISCHYEKPYFSIVIVFFDI